MRYGDAKEAAEECAKQHSTSKALQHKSPTQSLGYGSSQGRPEAWPNTQGGEAGMHTAGQRAWGTGGSCREQLVTR